MSSYCYITYFRREMRQLLQDATVCSVAYRQRRHFFVSQKIFQRREYLIQSLCLDGGIVERLDTDRCAFTASRARDTQVRHIHRVTAPGGPYLWRRLGQYLYFCTSKASELSMSSKLSTSCRLADSQFGGQGDARAVSVVEIWIKPAPLLHR